MSELKHTPGPWTPDGGRKNGQVVFVEEPDGGKRCFVGRFTESGMWKTVAKVNGQLKSESVANARLIAAAPDLLEALNAIFARINGEWDNPALVSFGELSINSDFDILRIANHAIRKAEGIDR